MSNVTTVGIDLAKNVFSVHGVDAKGREVLRRTVRRDQLAALVAQWPRCLIGMEACSGAHEWARRFSALGHTVRLMAPKFVTPYYGVGPLSASAIIASVGNAHEFANGRQFAAWLGLVPRQYSTGGKTRLGRITRRGDPYLRTLLILGARTVLQAAERRQDRLSRWALAVRERRGYHRACVAVAAKNARIVWALLANDAELRMADA
ncbi:MAG: transposase [Gammaproteobacteria bacterium]|nr:transposase [Gammaproteobacteria bacterium]